MASQLLKLKTKIHRFFNQINWIKRNEKIYANLEIVSLTRKERLELKHKWKGIELKYCWKDFEILKTICGFNIDLIPISVFDTYVIPVLNPYHDRRSLANKSVEFYLGDLPKPESIGRSVRGVVMDTNNHIITKEQLITMLKTIDEPLVFKRGIDSSGGLGVTISKPSELNLDKVIDSLGETYIIQKRVRQSPWFENLNETSLSTIRCTTLLLDDGPHLVSAQLKISQKGAKLDNANFGSVFVGIDEDGKLKDYGYKKGLVKVYEQNGKKFGGLKIPEWNKIRCFVETNALRLATCKVIGWDIAVREDGVPILIEANLNCPGVTIEQACSGPIFGKYTDEVIRIVNAQVDGN